MLEKKFNFFEFDDFADKKSGKNNMQLSTIRMLDNARKHATEKAGHNVPIIVLSGYRDDSHPESLLNPTSSHILGLAVDVTTSNKADLKYVEYGLRKAGFTRIGINNGSIHADNDTSKTMNVTWFYNGDKTIYNSKEMYYNV